MDTFFRKRKRKNERIIIVLSIVTKQVYFHASELLLISIWAEAAITQIQQLFSTKKNCCVGPFFGSKKAHSYFERTSSMLKIAGIHQTLKLGQNQAKKKQKKQSYESVSKLN